MADMVLERQGQGHWTVLRVSGELDLHTSPALRDRLLELLDEGIDRLAIDLEHVGFMDSSSLGVLVTTLKRLRERGGDMALVGANGSPLKVLSLTGIDRLVPSYATLSELPPE